MLEKLVAFLHQSYMGIFIFAVIIFIVLAYVLMNKKKELEKLKTLLREKEEKIEALRQYAYEAETKRVAREHEVEKNEIVFKQTIKELELQKKEGLKSQVVMKIDEYQNRRASQLKRVNLTQA